MDTPKDYSFKTYIYGLLEEGEDIIKYIGKSNHPKIRFRQHINHSIKNKTAKDSWIQSVLKRNKKIYFIILEEIIDYETWPEREVFWIDKYKEQLKNHSLGGKGGKMINYDLSYEDTKKWVKENLNGIDSISKWNKISKDLPYFISRRPSDTYANRGWISFGDFFGTGRIQDNKLAENYISYNEAKKYIKKNKIILNNQKEWKVFTKTKDFPFFLSKRPDRFYKTKGWISWRDFLCNSKVRTVKFNYLNFKDCKKWIYEHNIKTSMEFRQIITNSPDFIPRKPERYYKSTKEWTSWYDFLSKTNKDFIKYDEAKKLIKNYNIKTNKEWRYFVKNDEFNYLQIPKSPDTTYKNKGWISWMDFLEK